MKIEVDGDAINATGIFTDEANGAIREKADFRKNNLSLDGDVMATMGNEVLYGCYNLTE